METESTQIFKQFEQGKDYINSLNMITKSDDAFRFYEGDHWRGLKSGDEKMPIIEIIRPVVDYKVAIVTQNMLQIFYSSMNFENPLIRMQTQQICEKLNEHIARVWENNSMDNVNAQLVREACIAGEKYMYLYFKKSGKVENGQEINGEIAFELVDNVNVMFADEQERDIQKQPYVLLISRKLVRDVKNEAKQNGIPKSEIDFIISDEATDLQSGDSAKKEVKNDDKKCLCIVKLFKEDGKVYVEKSTKSVVYQKKTLLGLTNYPIAKFVWSDKKGSCRGEGDVYRYIPNQIWVNKLEAYRLLSAKLFAFPKLIHSDRIANKNAITDVGVALEVKDDGINAVMQSVGYLNPAPMSNDAKAVLDELMAYTKQAAGASDVALGNTKADNYRAILAVQEANKAPLSSQVERYKKYIEDLARIYYDFWVTYYPNGLPVITQKEVSDELGNLVMTEVQEVISQEELRDLSVQIKVDITSATPYNRLAEQQKADNLLQGGFLVPEETPQLKNYVDILPEDEEIKPKLEMVIEKNGMVMQTQQQMQMIMQENEQLKQILMQVQDMQAIQETKQENMQDAAQNTAGLSTKES
ncbi:MAG: hypothetical protein RR777_05635 [Christensenellaceae bacterium]